jgi:hypothetical protein
MRESDVKSHFGRRCFDRIRRRDTERLVFFHPFETVLIRRRDPPRLGNEVKNMTDV